MTFTLSIKTAEERATEQVAVLTAQIVAAVDGVVEEQAKATGYNSAAHCASYVTSTVAGWASEAQAFVAWRDAVWLAAFNHQTQVEAGQAAPTIEAALAALPAWTE